METKNSIIQNYANDILNSANILNSSVSFIEDYDVNKAIIANINVLVGSIRSQLSLLQNVIDEY